MAHFAGLPRPEYQVAGAAPSMEDFSNNARWHGSPNCYCKPPTSYPQTVPLICMNIECIFNHERFQERGLVR